MKYTNFDNIADFCENIVDEFAELENPEFNCINVIARYEYAKKIIQELILSGLEINSITDFAPFEQDGYDDEYIITIDEYGIWVQPEKYKDCDGKYGEYINVFSDICYVMNDSNISILNYINHTSNEVFIVKLTDHERCNDCDYENYCCKIGNGFTISNDKTVKISKDEYNEAVKNISDFLGFVSKFCNIVHYE